MKQIFRRELTIKSLLGGISQPITKAKPMYKFSTFIYLDIELKIQNFRFEMNFEKYKQVEQIKNKTFFGYL